MPIDIINNNDYISRDDYNALCSEISEAKGGRGLGDNAPGEVSPGQIVTRTHITSLQEFVKQTIRYQSEIVYPFTPVSTSEKPLSQIYNEVRQVVIDLKTNQRCVNCSNICRESCSTSCHSICGSGCSNSCVGGCSADNCSVNCGHGCTNVCHYDTCTGGCKGANCTGNCYSSCVNSCSSACRGSCRGSCSASCASSATI